MNFYIQEELVVEKGLNVTSESWTKESSTYKKISQALEANQSVLLFAENSNTLTCVKKIKASNPELSEENLEKLIVSINEPSLQEIIPTLNNHDNLSLLVVDGLRKGVYKDVTLEQYLATLQSNVNLEIFINLMYEI